MGIQSNASWSYLVARGRGGNTRQGFLIAFNNQAIGLIAAFGPFGAFVSGRALKRKEEALCLA